MNLLILRLKKLAISVFNPFSWPAMLQGVFASIEHLNILKTLNVDGVIDVGANRGQFTLACRIALPGLTIVAFEPIPSEASTFHKVHGSTPYIKLIESALGETSGSAILHLSKSADSSSLLPIGSRQRELHHNTAEVGTIEVPIQRLDDLDVYWHPKKHLLLKLDVQGYELNVLKGSQEALKHCAYVYAECSEVPLYDGQALRPEVQSFLEARGFTLQGRYNEQWDKECLIQADYLFTRG